LTEPMPATVPSCCFASRITMVAARCAVIADGYFDRTDGILPTLGLYPLRRRFVNIVPIRKGIDSNLICGGR
jgi:hypothetical protein